MKKSCDYCKAYNPVKHRCDLEYKIKHKYYDCIIIGGIPLEQCPKPKKTTRYLELMERYKIKLILKGKRKE